MGSGAAAGYGGFLVLACSLGATGCEDFAAPVPPGPSDATWSLSFGDDLPQEALAVAADAFGNVYVTGGFEGTIDLGGGPLTAAGADDIFIAKYDTDGVHRWSVRFGDGASQRGTALALDPVGNVVVAGLLSGAAEFGGPYLQSTSGYDVFVVKLTPEGEHLASASYGGMGNEHVRALAVGSDGHIVLGGDFDAEIDFGGGPLGTAGLNDVFVARLTAEAEPSWSLRFGDIDDDRLTGIDVRADGRIALTGYTNGAIAFGGEPLPPAGLEDAFVAVLEAGGEHVWSKRLGDENPQRGHGVAFDGSGQLVAVGSFGGRVDFGGGVEQVSTSGWDIYVVKLRNNGAPSWARSYGVSGDQQGYRVAVDRDGNVVLAGDFRDVVSFGGEQLESAGETDVYLAKLDAAGGHLASHRFGDAMEQHLADLAVDTAGHAIVVGRNFGVIDFGFGPLESSGESDPFVAKLQP